MHPFFRRMSLGRKERAQSNPGINQAESGAPHATPYATLRGNTVVAAPMPLLPRNEMKAFRGNVGVNVSRAARAFVVVPREPYNGVMPMREQPTLRKPLPYR